MSKKGAMKISTLSVTELCYGAVGARGPTANAYLPGTDGGLPPGGNAPGASSAETTRTMGWDPNTS